MFYDLFYTRFIEGRKQLWLKNYFVKGVLYFFSCPISQNDVSVTFPRGRLMRNHAWQRTPLSRSCGGSCRGKVLGKWKMSKHYSNSADKQRGEWNFYRTVAIKTTKPKTDVVVNDSKRVNPKIIINDILAMRYDGEMNNNKCNPREK